MCKVHRGCRELHCKSEVNEIIDFKYFVVHSTLQICDIEGKITTTYFLQTTNFFLNLLHANAISRFGLIGNDTEINKQHLLVFYSIFLFLVMISFVGVKP